MKLSRMLFKPRWQDKDAVVRAAAVANDSDPELAAALPELTRSDPDPRVRLAALKRLGDYERWRERSTADADADLRSKARAAYIALLCSGGAGTPSLPRLVNELETLSPSEIETVVTTARDRDLRAAALPCVLRPALLAERAVSDPDPRLRLAALERIVDAAALERIAERTRKSDKTVSRHARERLEAMRIGSGDADAIAARARLLCERMESLLRAPGPDAREAAAAIGAEWNRLGAAATGSLSARFDGAVAVLTRLLAERKRDVVPAPDELADVDVGIAAQAMPTPQTPATVAAAEPPEDPPQAERDPQTGPIVSRARFDAALATAAEHSRRDREHQTAAAHKIEQLVQRFESQLEAGDISAALATHAQLDQLAAGAPATKAAVERRLSRHEARFGELKRWQHWSNQRRRRALCHEIESLPGAGLHPDAIATKVQEARDEWQRLDAMEGHAKSAESSGLARHFFAACQRALKPARAYFEKRDAVRDTRRGELEALLARTAQVPGDEANWKDLSVLRRDLGAALRSVDALNPRDRNQFARRLKAAIAALSPRLEGHAQEVERAKARLIERAQALASKADKGAPRAVRDLQQQWTALGEGLRSTDQKQWREFRGACDTVFGALDTERKQREEQSAGQTARARALIVDAEAVLADPPASADEIAARRRELETAWRSLETADRRLEQRFRQIVASISEHGTQLARAGRMARYTDALDRWRALRRIEKEEADACEADWTSEGLADDFAAALEARRLPRVDGPDAAVAEPARDILVRLEFLAGIASPPEDRERRMNYQVSRLSARMRGGASTGPEQELTALMIAWFGLRGSLPGPLEQRFDSAANAALSILP